jgi:hypothetical protein
MQSLNRRAGGDPWRPGRERIAQESKNNPADGADGGRRNPKNNPTRGAHGGRSEKSEE